MPNNNQWAAPLGISLSPLTTGSAPLPSTNRNFCPGQPGLSLGAFGVPLAHDIVETGIPAPGGFATAAHQVTIGATFCIGSVNGVVDAAGDLPGPGAFSLVADVSLVP